MSNLDDVESSKRSKGTPGTWATMLPSSFYPMPFLRAWMEKSGTM